MIKKKLHEVLLVRLSHFSYFLLVAYIFVRLLFCLITHLSLIYERYYISFSKFLHDLVTFYYVYWNIQSFFSRIYVTLSIFHVSLLIFFSHTIDTPLRYYENVHETIVAWESYEDHLKEEKKENTNKTKNQYNDPLAPLLMVGSRKHSNYNKLEN